MQLPGNLLLLSISVILLKNLPVHPLKLLLALTGLEEVINLKARAWGMTEYSPSLKLPLYLDIFFDRHPFLQEKSTNSEEKRIMKKFGVKSGVLCIILATFLLFPALAQAKKKAKTGPHIVVTCPKPHQCVTSPLSVMGKAKGAWITDGSIAMTLVDDKGNQIATGTAKAQGDWETMQKKNQFVTFDGKMDFSVDKTTKAKLVLESTGQAQTPAPTGTPAQEQTPGAMKQETPAAGQTQAAQLKKEIPVVLSAGKKKK
jgi:Immunoglobulin-like domain of bacterial spore germination